MLIYYISKYHSLNPIYQILFLLFFSFILKSLFDFIPFAFCMEDPPIERLMPPTAEGTQETKPAKHVHFVFSDDHEGTREYQQHLRDELRKCKRAIKNYRFIISEQEHTVEIQERVISDLEQQAREYRNKIKLLRDAIFAQRSKLETLEKSFAQL